MYNISAEQWNELDTVLLWLHTQSEQELIRRGFLARLEELIPHKASFFDLCTRRDGRLYFFDPVSNNMSSEQLSAYYEKYQYSDYVAWSLSGNEPLVYRDSDMVSAEAREGSTIYREWMQPMDAYYSIGSTVMSGGQVFGSVTLFRSKAQGDFSGDEVAMLTVLNRHLSAHFAFLWPDGVLVRDNDNLDRLALQYGLSQRECEIAELISKGCTNQQIGQKLFISINTVKKHTNSLYRKLGVTNRTQMLRFVYSPLPPGGPSA